MTTGSAGQRRLEGKVAIVTGAGGGIGREHALLLAQQGARVVVNDIGVRESASAAGVVDEIRAAGGEAVASTDSATWEGAAAIVETAVAAYGGVDVLVNNAGFAAFGGIQGYTEANWDATIEVGLKGYYAMTQAVVPHMVERGGGAVVNTSSAAGYGAPAYVAYASAKEGVLGLTRSLARELGRLDIRVNAIRPIASTNPGGSLKDRAGKWLELIELTAVPRILAATHAKESGKEVMAPRKSAVFAVWLCTDAAAGVNGEVFELHGDTLTRLEAPQPVRAVYREGGWDLDSLDRVAPAELTDGLADAFAMHDRPELRDPAL